MKSLKKTKELFAKNNYSITTEDKKDLSHRLKSKSYYLYEMAINVLIKNSINITYDNVSLFLRIEIRIRNDARNFITAMEEIIWNIYIGFLEDKHLPINMMQLSESKTLNKIIKEMNKPEWDIIRKIRNDVSHLCYFITYEKISNLQDSLFQIKNFDFVVSSTVDSLVEKINKNIELFENMN